MLRNTLDKAISHFGLPDRIDLRGHLVVDIDDVILCSDLSFNNISIGSAAYFGANHTFEMWAPLRFTSHDLDPSSPISSGLTLVKDFGLATWDERWSLVESNPMKCWQGDSGPFTAIDR